MAGSVAILAFGIDSFVECASALVMFGAYMLHHRRYRTRRPTTLARHYGFQVDLTPHGHRPRSATLEKGVVAELYVRQDLARNRCTGRTDEA